MARAALVVAGSLIAAGALAGCGDDDSIDEPIVIRADNGVAQCGKPLVYLNFDGITIRKGAADDSRTNVSQIPDYPDEGLVVPPYPALDRARLRDLVYAKLAEQRIPAVQARPTSGDYHMLVFSNVFLPGVQSGRSITNCGFTNRNTIGVLNTAFYSIHGGLEYATQGAMLVIGRAAGLDPVASSVVGANCMANDAFLASCTFFPVTATLGPCTTSGQDQAAGLAGLACN